ncbi:MAG TPA: hypothetical protein DCE42_07075 [Myxococcales bacterium]|nr:hypothetical protein [Deltaproteobacteria bacterium]MBU50855.1 hypothetical protein [Deltaproteobacteria bacterium]HAA54501.1 hypothetical protein [Myxococcales bacterium]
MMRSNFLRSCLACCLALAMYAPLNTYAAPKKKKFKITSELQNTKFMSMYKEALQKLRVGQVDTAIGTATGLLRTYPRSPRTLSLLGYAYKTKKMYNKAIDYFQRSSRLFNEKSEFFEKGQVLYNAAYCYELLKKRLAAVAAWNVYVSFASSFPQEAASVAFARARIQALQSVKVKK